MNKSLEESKIWHSYHIPGQQSRCTLKKNAIFISTGNTLRHEMAKFIGCFMIKKYGDVKFDDDLKKMILTTSVYVEEKLMKAFFKESCNYITEACPNREPNRRVDVVNITNGDRFEFESLKSVKKPESLDGSQTVTIYL